MIHKSTILRDEDEFARTERIHMTLLCEQDYDTFFGEARVFSKAVQKLGVLEGFRAEVWKKVNSDDTITLMIWDNESGAFVGYGQYKNLLSGEVDLGIELEEPCRGKGLATKCAPASSRCFSHEWKREASRHRSGWQRGKRCVGLLKLGKQSREILAFIMSTGFCHRAPFNSK